MAQATPPQEHLYAVLKDFDHAMLVTRSLDGDLHARPMAVAKLAPDADAYFVTSIESPKVSELEANPQATLTFQGAQRFAALQGTIEVLRDRELLDRLWKKAWKVWFPKGKDDPNIAVLKFEADRGELWDNAGAEGIKYAFQAAKAYMKGEQVSPDGQQHERIDL